MKRCPHYFLSDVNLFEDVPSEFLTTVGQKLVNIRRDPCKHLPPISVNTSKILCNGPPDEYKTRCSDAIFHLLKELEADVQLHPHNEEPSESCSTWFYDSSSFFFSRYTWTASSTLQWYYGYITMFVWSDIVADFVCTLYLCFLVLIMSYTIRRWVSDETRAQVYRIKISMEKSCCKIEVIEGTVQRSYTCMIGTDK